jgi:hypothetical protein
MSIFRLNVFGDQAGAPAELHEIHELANAVYRVLESAGEQPRIDDYSEPTPLWFGLEVR